jgi:hypothetical protein
MFKDEKALTDVRRKVAEKLNKDGKRLTFGWRGEPEPTRKEGDEWYDVDGKKWTIKNGIRQSVTKQDAAKTPWWCPKCSKPMNERFDVKFWRLRPEAWEKYERTIMLRNYIAETQDKIAELQDYHDTITKPEFVNADETKILMIEKWDVDIEKVKADLRKDIAQLQEWLAETIEKYGTGEENEG